MANQKKGQTEEIKTDNKLYGLQYPSPDKVAQRTSTVTRAMASTLAAIIEVSENDTDKILDMAALLYFGEIYKNLTEDQKEKCENYKNGSGVTCVYCGKEAKQLDHLYPLVDDKTPTGYSTEPENLVPCCGDCNGSKGSKTWNKYMDIAGKDKNTKFVQRLLNGGEDALDKRRERLGKYCEHFGLPDRIKRNYKDSHNVKEWWENMSAAINKKLEVAQFQIEAFNAGASEYRHNGNNNQKRLNKVFQEYISSIYDRKNDRDLLKRILKTLCVDSNSQNKYYKEGLKAFKLGFCFERSIMNT